MSGQHKLRQRRGLLWLTVTVIAIWLIALYGIPVALRWLDNAFPAPPLYHAPRELPCTAALLRLADVASAMTPGRDGRITGKQITAIAIASDAVVDHCEPRGRPQLPG